MEPLVAAQEPRRPVTHAITAEITGWITSGRFKPGDHLPSEGDLAKAFNVSKPSVRESLKHLVAIGAVEISHGRPATVRAMGSQPLVTFFHLAVTDESGGLREAIELRRGLEIQSTLLATERRTEDDIAEMGRLIALLDKHKSERDLWVPAHVAFHVALVKAAHNRFYTFLQDALQETIERTNRHLLAAQPRRDADVAFRRHLDLFDAIKSGDTGRARTAIETHFEAVDVVLKSSLSGASA
ncbi:MAG: FadR/GntR family transcriptional regulator [Pseudomonadota bacterium]